MVGAIERQGGGGVGAAIIDVELRHANEDDLPFLLALRRETMTEHEAAMGKVRSPEEVRARVLAAFDAARIVLLRGVAVGMMKVVRSDNGWELVQMQVSPAHQGQGIGSLLLGRLCTEARDAGADLTLKVLKSNPARRLYARHGFSVAGETTAVYTMRVVNGER